MSYTQYKSVTFGTSKGGLATVGYALFNADGSPNGSRITAGVTERGTATGIYGATVTLPDAFSGEIRWDTGGATPAYASEDIDTPAVNVTMVKGAAINDLVDGNVVARLAAAQPAVEFGQVKITANVPNQGALHVVNSNADGQGVFYTGGEYGQISQGGRAGVLGVDEPGIRTAIGMAAASFDTDMAAVAKTGADSDTLETLSDQIDGIGAGGLTAQETANAVHNLAPVGAVADGSIGDKLNDLPVTFTSTLASFVNTYSTDSTAAGSITRRRGDSWTIVPAALGVLTGYTSLWLTIKSSDEDEDEDAILHVKKNASGLLDGLLYLNGAASTSNLASITVTDAATGVVSIVVDEAATKELAPGEYYYDIQALIAGNVSTPDSGTFTVTADVTRSVA